MSHSARNFRRRLLAPIAMAVMLSAGAVLSGCTVVGTVVGGVLGGLVGGPEGAAAGAELGLYMGAGFDMAVIEGMHAPNYDDDDWYGDIAPDEWYLEEYEDTDEAVYVQP